MPIPNRGQWERIVRTVRRDEAEAGARGVANEGRPGGHGGIHVKVKGSPVVVTTTTTTSTGTTPTTTSTTTTAGSTSTTCPPRPTTTAVPTATTTPGPIYLYPGVFAYRDVDSLTNQEWWHEGDDVWIQDTQNRGLGQNCVFPGQLAGEYQGQVVIGVRGNGSASPCDLGGTATLTTAGCAGFCKWSMDAGTGKWTLVSNTCCPSGTCDCPQPDFCPPDNSCANTVTFCSQDANRLTPFVNCGPTTTGTTGTTGTTTTGTSTTPDPSLCGMGCSCKYIEGIGTVVISNDCGMAELANGCVCTGNCFCVGNSASPCTVVTAACETRCPPPPPVPFCGGDCTWVSTGQAWVQLTNHCNGNIPCGCQPPSTIGACNARQRTLCFTPPPPVTTSGTGTTPAPTTTLLSPTTTTRGGCGDECLLQWNPGLGRWLVVSDCGMSCGCADPGYNGDDSCSLAFVPCQPSTTGTSTTTTGTGTTTTGTGTTTTTLTSATTTPPPRCCGVLSNCVFQCVQFSTTIGPNGLPIPNYQWVTCNNTCDVCATCTNPLGVNVSTCNSNTVGACVIGFCQSHPAVDTGPCSCGVGTCWNGTECVACTDSGITPGGTGVRCPDCMQILPADAPLLGETGAF